MKAAVHQSRLMHRRGSRRAGTAARRLYFARQAVRMARTPRRSMVRHPSSFPSELFVMQAELTQGERLAARRRAGSKHGHRNCFLSLCSSVMYREAGNSHEVPTVDQVPAQHREGSTCCASDMSRGRPFVSNFTCWSPGAAGVRCGEGAVRAREAEAACWLFPAREGRSPQPARSPM